MGRLRNYLLIAFGIIVIFNWLIGIPKKLVASYNDSSSSPALNALKGVDISSIPLGELKKHISQGYGATLFAAINLNYLKPRHNGIDIVASLGAPVLSPTEGAVFMAGNQDRYCPGRGYGKFVVVKNSGDGYSFLYAHLSKVSVKDGDAVKVGDVLGLVGRTGFATNSHLHFTVFKTDTIHVTDENGCGPNPRGEDMSPLKYLESIEK